MIRPVALALLVASSALAQTPAEYGATGGEVSMITKHSRSWSGSLGATAGQGELRGFEGTLGGTLVDDKMWFFGSVLQTESRLTQFASPAAVGQAGQINAADAKIDAQFGRNSLNASFSSKQGNALVTPFTYAALPTSFLNLRYTAAVSSNVLFNATVTRTQHQPSPFGQQ